LIAHEGKVNNLFATTGTKSPVFGGGHLIPVLMTWGWNIQAGLSWHGFDLTWRCILHFNYTELEKKFLFCT